MKIVIALDSFKGSLTFREADEAAAAGARRAAPEAEILLCPVADGGEGTADALGGTPIGVTVSDPLGRPIRAQYRILEEDGARRAVIEMAAAAGLPLLRHEEYDPRRAATFGVGELILDALSRGCRRFTIGIGGSATNDGGAGMLSALGFRLLDAAGAPIPPGADGLALLSRIEDVGVPAAVRASSFTVACDVTNPLLGPTGCSAVYGPQKGASPRDVAAMEAAMTHYAAVVRAWNPSADDKLPGSGAAGGMGFALRTFLGASLRPGAEAVLEAAHLEEMLRGADLVLCGEGQIDAQTAMGKAPLAVARLARRAGAAVVALGGAVRPDAAACHGAFDAIFPILRAPCPLEEAMSPGCARENLAAAAESVVRLFRRARERTEGERDK